MLPVRVKCEGRRERKIANVEFWPHTLTEFSLCRLNLCISLWILWKAFFIPCKEAIKVRFSCQKKTQYTVFWSLKVDVAIWQNDVMPVSIFPRMCFLWSIPIKFTKFRLKSSLWCLFSHSKRNSCQRKTLKQDKQLSRDVFEAFSCFFIFLKKTRQNSQHFWQCFIEKQHLTLAHAKNWTKIRENKKNYTGF